MCHYSTHSFGFIRSRHANIVLRTAQSSPANIPLEAMASSRLHRTLCLPSCSSRLSRARTYALRDFVAESRYRLLKTRIRPMSGATNELNKNRERWLRLPLDYRRKENERERERERVREREKASRSD